MTRIPSIIYLIIAELSFFLSVTLSRHKRVRDTICHGKGSKTDNKNNINRPNQVSTTPEDVPSNDEDIESEDEIEINKVPLPTCRPDDNKKKEQIAETTKPKTNQFAIY